MCAKKEIAVDVISNFFRFTFIEIFGKCKTLYFILDQSITAHYFPLCYFKPYNILKHRLSCHFLKIQGV